MNDRRRRPKRGVRLSDLPEHVVRDLPEFAPEDPLTVAVRGGRVTQRRVIEATKQVIDAPQPKPKKGAKRQPKRAKEVLHNFTFQAPPVSVETDRKSTRLNSRHEW